MGVLNRRNFPHMPAYCEHVGFKKLIVHVKGFCFLEIKNQALDET